MTIPSATGAVPEPERPQFEDVMVASIGPLRIQRDGDVKPLPFTPDLLVDEASLLAGDKVRVEFNGGRVIIHGRYTLINGETKP